MRETDTFGWVHERGKGPDTCMCDRCFKARQAATPDLSEAAIEELGVKMAYDRAAHMAAIQKRGYVSDAGISSDGVYRYWLTRDWSPLAMTGQVHGRLAPGIDATHTLAANVKLPFIMFNPSTADGDVDDPTIRKCIGFAKRRGYGGIQVVNLYAMRATNPRVLQDALIDRLVDASGPDPIGPASDKFIWNMARHTVLLGFPKVVCAWGAIPLTGKSYRVARVLGLLEAQGAQAVCFGKSKDGSPRHPLMLSYETELVPYGG